MLKKTIVAAALLSSLSAFAAGNLVTCGSFECMGTPAGTLTIYTDNSFYGWDVVSGPGIEERNNLVGKAQDGHSYVELDSTANTTIQQSINTVAGQTYQLSFYASSRAVEHDWNYGFAHDGIITADTQGLTATFGNTVINVATPVNTTADNIWTLYTGTFKATGSTTLLSFAATGISDSYGTALDNVSVSAVPEPESIAMMATGLLAMGAFARRRNGRK